MFYFYFVLNFQNSFETYQKITEILGVEPRSQNKSRFSPEVPNSWSYWVESEDYFDFINHFLDILEPKIDELAKLGIECKNQDIVFWYVYEYEKQCNMEFHPAEMKRLGEAGIPLAISCFEKAD
jgi:hypothetical protein